MATICAVTTSSPKRPMAQSSGSTAIIAMEPMTASGSCTGCSRDPLMRLHARGDRRDHAGRLFERVEISAFDVVAARDPGEIRVRSPHVAVLVLEHQHAYRPVQSGERIRVDEQRA